MSKKKEQMKQFEDLMKFANKKTREAMMRALKK